MRRSLTLIPLLALCLVTACGTDDGAGTVFGAPPESGAHVTPVATPVPTSRRTAPPVQPAEEGNETMADVVVRVRTQSLGCDEVKGSQFKSVPGSGFTVHLDGAETVPGVLDEGAELYGECVYSGIVSVRYSRGETYSVELDVAGLDPGEVLVLPVVFYGSDMVPPPANVSYEAEVLLID